MFVGQGSGPRDVDRKLWVAGLGSRGLRVVGRGYWVGSWCWSRVADGSRALVVGRGTLGIGSRLRVARRGRGALVVDRGSRGRIARRGPRIIGRGRWPRVPRRLGRGSGVSGLGCESRASDHGPWIWGRWPQIAGVAGCCSGRTRRRDKGEQMQQHRDHDAYGVVGNRHPTHDPTAPWRATRLAARDPQTAARDQQTAARDQ